MEERYQSKDLNQSSLNYGKVGFAFCITNLVIMSLYLLIVPFILYIVSNVINDYGQYYYDYRIDIILVLCAFIVIIAWGLSLVALILTSVGRKRILRGDMSGVTMYYVAAGFSIPLGVLGIVAGAMLITSGVTLRKSRDESRNYDNDRNPEGF